MSAKNKPSKPLPPNYIAFDGNRQEVIALGTKEYVLDEIKEYCDLEGLDEDAIMTNIEVYELGKQVDFNVETQLEIYF